MLNRLLNFYQRVAARRMFSRWSPEYEDDVQENSYSAPDEVARAALKYLAQADAKNPRIADIGIGTGLLAQQIYDSLPCRITGLDFTEDMMASCVGRDITELLIKCDAGRDHWPMENGSQTAVVSAGLFEYLMPDMAQHFFRESVRVLQKNGLLVFTYMPAKAGQRRIGLWRGRSGTYLICGYTEQEMETHLRRSNFTILEHSPPFKGSIFQDGSSYDYRLIAAKAS